MLSFRRRAQVPPSSECHPPRHQTSSELVLNFLHNSHFGPRISSYNLPRRLISRLVILSGSPCSRSPTLALLDGSRPRV